MRVTSPMTRGLISRLSLASRANSNRTSATATLLTVMVNVSVLPVWRGGGGNRGAAFGCKGESGAALAAVGVAPGAFSRCGAAAQPARPSITKASAMRRQAIPLSDPFTASRGQVFDVELLIRLCAA